MKYFPKNDPWQQHVPEEKRKYGEQCSYMIEMDDGYVHHEYNDVCHARAYPDRQFNIEVKAIKWCPKSVTTDLRKSKQSAAWYEFMLDEKISPYRNGAIKGCERIVGDDGFLRAVKLTNMDCDTQEMLNFLVMTSMTFEFPAQVITWNKLVAAGASPHAAMVACHLFNRSGEGDKCTRYMYDMGHHAMNIDPKGCRQPSVKRLIDATPVLSAGTYRAGGSPYGFSSIWGLVGLDDPRVVFKAASVRDKVEVVLYTGSFGSMYRRMDGEKTFGLAQTNYEDNTPYTLANIAKSAYLWSQL